MRSDRYRYYNRNPDKVKEEDCVCRAISTALGIRYDAASRLLDLSAEVNQCDTLCVCCYRYLLSDILCLDGYTVDGSVTVADVAADHPNDRVIIRVDGHLTCSINGVVLDIWDCTE